MRVSSSRSVLFVMLAATLSAATARATCGGGGGGGVGGMTPRGGGSEPAQVYHVPWKVVQPGTAAASTPLALYWLPATREEVKGSDLLVSRQLTVYSGQCVGMQLVAPEDTATIEKLGATGKLPAAILVDTEGKVIRQADAVDGKLKVGSVEKMLKDELAAREKAVNSQLDEAKKKAAADKASAIAQYTKVWEQRCLFPSTARKAQRALKDLGVEVKDSELRPIDPDLSPATNAKISKLMARGLQAEMDEHYTEARNLYAAAAKIDAADAIPLRYLGELHRHHTGEWAKARQTFDRLLAMQPDTISRAVALHGLGKMTIHEGEYKKGLRLFEQSIAVFPLAITYRNLAVYWNSEHDHQKAYAYVQQALALEPQDPYNLVFAATYMADNGRADEALRIAKENEALLPASYNLAAIYSLLGNKGKAMELLRRHFYSYERYDAVRAHEMMEARVDYVFESLRGDKEFQELTAKAN
jgi:tetratricopeptide (TPR) repeat protein